MHYLIITLAVIGVIAGALTGILWYLQTAQKIIQRDLQHGIVIGKIRHVAIVVGALAGSAVRG